MKANKQFMDIIFFIFWVHHRIYDIAFEIKKIVSVYFINFMCFFYCRISL